MRGFALGGVDAPEAIAALTGTHVRGKTGIEVG